MSDFIIPTGARVLFQGDSITDCGRNREDLNSLGQGYASMVAGQLSLRHPDHGITFINRGISGNRIYDMETRWLKDCIDLAPDFVSILIGINDTWRFFDSNTESPIAEFESCYRRLLDTLINEAGARVMILEPFVLPVPADRIAWRTDVDARIEAVRRVALDYDTLYIPVDKIFNDMYTTHPRTTWAGDGVHPSPAGHALIAQEWIGTVNG